MDQPALVSVIIPVYNGQQYLAEAIESTLAQTYRPLEVIVVDDGSTDGSAEVARRFVPAVRYVSQPHSGAAAARNHGVKEAQGQYISFLDCDDLWVQHKLERQMACFSADPALDTVSGHVEQFVSPELGEEFRRNFRFSPFPLPGPGPLTMLIRREAFLRVGFFETGYTVGESIEWYARAVAMGLKRVMLPDVLQKRRIHRDNLGRRERAAQGDYLKIVRESLNRRRKESSGQCTSGSDPAQE
jgi:glycosyltransferase involved in cell wall biosynthesis